MYVDGIVLNDGQGSTITAQQISGFDEATDYTGSHKTVTQYDGTQRRSVTDARGNTTEFTYDALGRVIKTTYPATTQNPVTYVHRGYDGLGRKAWVSSQVTQEDPILLLDEDVRDYEYDSAGRLVAVTLPEDQMESPLHDDTVITARPRNEYVYDTYGNLVEQWDNIYVQGGNIVNTYARVTKFAYDELHNQISRELPDSATEYREYDEFGRLYYAEDFEGQITEFEYDSRGQLEYKKYYIDIAAYNAQNPAQTVQYVYDNLGRRTQVIEDANTTTYDYDEEGNLLGVDSPQGIVNYDYALITNRKVATWTANTETWYDYDELGRLKTAELVKCNGSPVSEPTTYEYTDVGSRWKAHLPNGVTTTYDYDNCNRLLSVTHEKPGPQQLSKYDYTLKADGMRETLTEATTSDRNVQYGYDNLNRVISETSDETTGDYSVEYTYDVVSNRTRRMISANGQCMQTDYEYNSRDQLTKETHIDPGVCYYLNDRPVYAYTSNGQITHYRFYGSSENISPFKAYLFGIPTKWSNYAMRAVFGLLAISFLLPGLLSFLQKQESRKAKRLSLFHRSMCVLLAFMMLINPSWLHQEAQAAINYGGLGASNWGTINTDIHYYYDANGSCIEKIEAVKDTADPNNNFIEKTVYTYNLQNRLASVEFTTNGTDWDVTAYKYNDDGIRVEKNGNGTVTTYLLDSHNHTGYAQVLEQWDTTSTPTLEKTYIIGDDVLAQATNTENPQYLLYDGHGSVRHHSDTNGDLVDYSGCDTFAYDAYGQRVDPLKDSVNEGLFYAGEQWDSSAQMYYLRARYYNPLTGLFNRMDPFTGNNLDPQSLHKYLYCHANPVNNLDPSGNMALTMNLNISMAIGAMILGITTIAINPAWRRANEQIAGAIINVLQDLIASGEYAVIAVYNEVVSNTRKVTKAIDDVAKALKKTIRELQKFKFFPVIKKLTPKIFKFNVEALATHPHWFMLTYNGAGDPQTGLNRAWIAGTYGWMRATAPPGYQLDEFPYACTRQGGAAGPALAHTAPAWENILQGSYLGVFTRWTLKGRPQPFIVVPIPL